MYDVPRRKRKTISYRFPACTQKNPSTFIFVFSTAPLRIVFFFLYPPYRRATRKYRKSYVVAVGFEKVFLRSITCLHRCVRRLRFCLLFYIYRDRKLAGLYTYMFYPYKKKSLDTGRRRRNRKRPQRTTRNSQTHANIIIIIIH